MTAHYTPEDLGVRCDRHVGEVFPPRCVTCEQLTSEWQSLNTAKLARPRPDLDAPVTCSVENPCQWCREAEDG